MLEKLIKEKKFDEAILYLEKNQDGAISNFNLAYLNFQKNDYIQSRVFLEKAQKLGLYSTEVNEAMTIVKRELGLEIIENSYFKEDHLIFKFTGFSADVYFSTIGLFLLISLLTFYKSKKILGSVALLLCIGVGCFYHYVKDFKTYVNKNEAVVYEGPSKIFSEKQILIPGMKVIINKSTKDWNYILYPKVYRGWAYKQEATEI